MRHPLDLKNLTVPFGSSKQVDECFARVEAKKQAYREKYGDAWEKALLEDRERENRIMRDKMLNSMLYSTGELGYSQHDINRWPEATRERFEKRRHEVYGDQYDELMSSRSKPEPRVGELLIQEALRTGYWEALPDCLVAEYRRRVGDNA